MPITYQDAGVARTPTQITYGDGGTNRTITEVWYGDAGTNRLVYSAGGGGGGGGGMSVSAPDLTGSSASPSIATGNTTAAATGGTGPYTYAWTVLSGGTGITFSGTSTATVFAQTNSGALQIRTAVLRVTATDSLGATDTQDVNVYLEVA